MDSVSIREKFSGFFKKYKYVILVLALGIFLMSLPEKEPEEIPEIQNTQPELSVSDSLENILAQIEGVGQVRVLLTESSGGEIIYQTDSDIQSSDTGSTHRVETVIISDAERKESGLIRQENPPTYLGAIVVCQGADQPSVQLAIITSVSNVTGISTDRITVLKMK